MDLARLIAAWHSATGGVARHRRLIAAGLAGLAVLAALHVLRPAPAATARVWVAAHSLAGGRPLAAADMTTERLPLADVPAGALAPPLGLAGRLLAAPMSRGEPFTSVRLLSPSLLVAAGLRGDVAVPVRTSDGPALVALVHSGDVVDVLAAADIDTSSIATPGTTVVHDVRVLATPSREDTDDSGETAGLLIVAATRAQAAALAAVAGTARLSVTVQSGP